MPSKQTFSVSLSFEKAQLPPFNDILLLGRKSPIGMSGVKKSLDFLVPDNFEIVPMEGPTVQAMVVNKAILKRLSIEKVIGVLQEAVIPYMSETEIMKVDLSVKVYFTTELAPE
jgi:hypothetical protein